MIYYADMVKKSSSNNTFTIEKIRVIWYNNIKKTFERYIYDQKEYSCNYCTRCASCMLVHFDCG